MAKVLPQPSAHRPFRTPFFARGWSLISRDPLPEFMRCLSFCAAGCPNLSTMEVGFVGFAGSLGAAHRKPLPPSSPSSARCTIFPGAVYVRTPEWVGGAPKRLAHPRSPMLPLSTLAARATHARKLLPPELASVPYGFVLVRFRVRSQCSRSCRWVKGASCSPGSESLASPAAKR